VPPWGGLQFLSASPPSVAVRWRAPLCAASNGGFAALTALRRNSAQFAALPCGAANWAERKPVDNAHPIHFPIFGKWIFDFRVTH